MINYDVTIIGGGAAGLIAAASLDNGIKTCILEKNKIPGRKIMATGGGRCNITNDACGQKGIALDFFRSLGLETYSDEEGRYYPYSNQASDVVKVLLDAINDKDTDIITEAEVTEVSFKDDHFIVSDAKGRTFTSKVLLVATGGKAAPQLGTTGDGYAMAKAFGHTMSKVYPILTGIKTGDMKDVKGVRAKGNVSLYKDNEMIASEMGEVQFNEDGISGICVMNMTPHITAEKGEPLEKALSRYHIELDMAPDFDASELACRKSSFGILSEKLSARVDIENIKNWKLPVIGVKGWKDAQCTAGGVTKDEIDMDTMGSMKKDALYFAGEVIDVQGPCGGFNLQNAWETGIRAANAINKRFR